jgi:serine protease AprX
MRRFWLLILLIFILTGTGYSQSRYWIFFKDKGRYSRLTTSEQQSVIDRHLTDRARERRLKRAMVSLNKTSAQQDLPLDEQYVSQVEQMGFTIHGKSRWFNAVSGTADVRILAEIRTLPFVESVRPVKSWTFSREAETGSSTGNLPPALNPQTFEFDYGPSAFQTQFHNIDKLHEKDLNGAGVIVAVFDTGFRIQIPSLEHIRSQLIAQYDFIQKDSITSNQPGDAPGQDGHGTYVLSVLGGLENGQLVGPAYGASFILAKTEIVNEEIHLEEDNWAMAAEWVESLGADIVSSSLGYSIFDQGEYSYSHADMNGRTTIVTRAANRLTQLGVVVVSSAGNEGNTSWHYITAPADGFYVLAVGALNSSNEVADFSSRGPTFDGRIKPDVCALGVNVYGATTGGSYQRASGTSASCPLTAGIVAQVLQAVPELNLLNILDILKGSSDSALNPDNNRGWGKVDALAAWTLATGGTFKRPEAYYAGSPRPNPYLRNSGVIFFPVDLPESALIRIDIYNILGQLVARLNYHGTHSQNLVVWDVRNFSGHIVPDGMYVYWIHTDKWEKFGKITIIN